MQYPNFQSQNKLHITTEVSGGPSCLCWACNTTFSRGGLHTETESWISDVFSSEYLTYQYVLRSIMFQAQIKGIQQNLSISYDSCIIENVSHRYATM